MKEGETIGASVWSYELWRHADKKPTKEKLLEHVIERLAHAIELAEREQFALAPFMAIGCPGIIREDGTIGRGSQNLPGNWQGFNLAAYVAKSLPKILGRDSIVGIHNDAVVQG